VSVSEKRRRSRELATSEDLTPGRVGYRGAWYGDRMMITFVIGSDVTKFRKSVTEIKQSCLMIAGFPLFFDLLFFATHLQTSNICTPQGPAARFRAVMLVIGFGLRGLALPKNSRPKSWQTTKFTINFHPLEHATRLE